MQEMHSEKDVDLERNHRKCRPELYLQYLISDVQAMLSFVHFIFNMGKLSEHFVLQLTNSH